MEHIPGYDEWKLSYPPEWDDEPCEHECYECGGVGELDGVECEECSGTGGCDGCCEPDDPDYYEEPDE